MPTKTRPSKRQAMRDAIASREPEVLGDEQSGDDQVLDLLVHVIERSGGRAPARLAIKAAFGGECDAKREMDVLKRVKADRRFRVEANGAGRNVLHLVATEDAAATQESLDEARTAAAGTTAGTSTDGALVVTGTIGIPAAPAPTLGDLVNAQQGKPQRITWPHGIGSSVMLHTEGYAPRRAIIKNIADHGGYVLYDLKVGDGETNEVPADRIGRDIDAEGEMAQLRQHCALIERHLARGKDMAQRYVEKQAEERKLSDHLSKFRKGIDELAAAIAEHNRTDPGQMELDDALRAAEAARPPRAERMDGEPDEAEDMFDASIDTAAVVAAESLGVDLDQLADARLEQATASTGKPQKVRPIVSGDALFVVTDVVDGVAVMLPIVGADGWQEQYGDEFGSALALPSETQAGPLAAGGRLCGCPVKVGRKTLWVGPERDAVLVRLPAEEERPTGKEAAAGR